MYGNNVKLSGTEKRAMRRAFEPSGFTRAQALRVISGSEDPDVVKRFEKHVSGHVKRAVVKRLAAIELLIELRGKTAMAEAEALREKRSAAAKKAAATRAAKKAAANAS